MKLAVAGEFRVVVRDRAHRAVRDTGWFPNLILDGGLNQICIGDWLSTCAIGTGTAAPQIGNAALSQPVASTTTIVSTTATALQTPPYAGYIERLFRFAAGQAVGNLSEIGVGWGTALFSRALIFDDSGNPTTVTVLSDQTIDVAYRVSNYCPSETTISSTILGVSRSITLRAQQATTEPVWRMTGSAMGMSSIVCYNGALGTATGYPSGTAAAMAVTPLAYETGSFRRQFVGEFTTAQGNLVGGISAVSLATNGLGAFQLRIDPPIVKTSATALTLRFHIAWGRKS